MRSLCNSDSETERLRLEPLERRHAAALFPLLQDPRIYRFIPQDPPASLEALEARYARLEQRSSPDGNEAWLNWAIRLRGEPIYVGRLEATIVRRGAALIAYELGTAYWGKGYATEACRWLLRELTLEAAVPEVLAQVDTRNQGSIRLLERLGFEQVAYEAAADWFKGCPSDEYTYRWRAQG
jgi:RimJ/RimL family protein N-acetyltransferase